MILRQIWLKLRETFAHIPTPKGLVQSMALYYCLSSFSTVLNLTNETDKQFQQIKSNKLILNFMITTIYFETLEIHDLNF